MAILQTHELPIGLSETRRRACWWLHGDHDEYDDDHAAIVLPASEYKAHAPPPRARPHDSEPISGENDVRRACPEVILHRSDGVVHPRRAPPRLLGLQSGACARCATGQRTCPRALWGGAPGWVVKAEGRECVHG